MMLQIAMVTSKHFNFVFVHSLTHLNLNEDTRSAGIDMGIITAESENKLPPNFTYRYVCLSNLSKV